MNEREEFLQVFRSAFIKMVERLDSMTESQVLEGIAAVKAARNLYKKELAERFEAITRAGSQERSRIAWAGGGTREEFAGLVSLQAMSHSLQQLQSRAGGRVRPFGTLPFDDLEAALHGRLEELRKGTS